MISQGNNTQRKAHSHNKPYKCKVKEAAQHWSRNKRELAKEAKNFHSETVATYFIY